MDFVDGSATVTYTDNTADIQLLENRVMEEHGDPPPSGTWFCEAHKQRMWYARTDTFPRRAYWSDPGDPDSVWGDNFIDFSDAETIGDVITGMIGDFEGHLITFTERAVWTLSGTGEIIGNISDWTRTKTNAQTGTVTKRSVVRVPAGSKFVDQNGEVKTTTAVALAYFTPLGDIRIFDGDNDAIISHPKKDALQLFNYEHRRKIFAIHDTARAEVTWCYPTGSDSEPGDAVTWNYRWGVWYEREWPFACGLEIETSSDASVLIAGGTNSGRISTLWDGNSFNGSNIEAIWMTKTLYGVNDKGQPALAHTKRWRWADLLFETDNTTTLTISWLQGNSPDNAAADGSVSFSPNAYQIWTSDGDTIVTVGGDTLILAASSSQVKVTLRNTGGNYLHHEGIRIRVGDNAALGSWSLEAFALAYQILPGLKRRFQVA